MRPDTKLLALAATSVLFTNAMAQGSPGTTFAPPVRLEAGDKFLGEARLFPSPVYHDIDGDGLQDIVVGDLRGLLTYALRKPTGDYGPEEKLKDVLGKDIDFHNW